MLCKAMGVLLLCLFNGYSFSQKTIVVADFSARGTTVERGQSIKNYVEVCLLKGKEYRVVSKQRDIEQFYKDTVLVGEYKEIVLLQPDFVLSGMVSVIGDVYTVTIKIIDGKNGELIKALQIKYQGPWEGIFVKVSEGIEGICNHIENITYKEETVSPMGRKVGVVSVILLTTLTMIFFSTKK